MAPPVVRQKIARAILLLLEWRIKGLQWSLAEGHRLDRPRRRLRNLIGYTHDYLVPEVVLDSHSTIASDIFQIGLVGYELATGQKYWQVDRNERLTKLKDAVPSAPLCGILCRCLSWEPDGRYRSAKAMLNAVKRCSA